MGFVLEHKNKRVMHCIILSMVICHTNFYKGGLLSIWSYFPSSGQSEKKKGVAPHGVSAASCGQVDIEVYVVPWDQSAHELSSAGS